MDDIKLIGERLHIGKTVKQKWFIKSPVRARRLSSGDGTVGFDRPEYMDLQSNLLKRQGVLILDMTTKRYVKVPIELLFKYEPIQKAVAGVKNTMLVWPLKQIVTENNLECINIPGGSIVMKDSIKSENEPVNEITLKKLSAHDPEIRKLVRELRERDFPFKAIPDELFKMGYANTRGGKFCFSSLCPETEISVKTQNSQCTDLKRQIEAAKALGFTSDQILDQIAKKG